MGLFDSKKTESITSYEKVFWRISGMRCSDEYEILSKDGIAEITEYRMYCASGGGMERRPERSRAVSDAEVIQLFNDCQILKWDGFHGKHPKNVRDGEMFTFSATVNEGRTINAEGSENFPKYFREFRNEIYRILSEGSTMLNQNTDVHSAKR
jgi:hypothetical protein